MSCRQFDGYFLLLLLLSEVQQVWDRGWRGHSGGLGSTAAILRDLGPSMGLGMFPSAIVMLVSCFGGVLVVMLGQNAILHRRGGGVAPVVKSFRPFSMDTVQWLGCDGSAVRV